MKNILFGTVFVLAGSITPAALALPAATVLFTQNGTQIISSDGTARPARQGDVLQTGERLSTPAGAIAQILLTDGSLLGLRSGSELKIDRPAPDSGKQVVVLLQGALRVIGSELMDVKKPSALTVQSGAATMTLKGADLESSMVRADGVKPQGAHDPGSYNRLLAGAGSIGNGVSTVALAPRQVSFVGIANAAPVVTLNSVSRDVFSGTGPTAAAKQGVRDTEKGMGPVAPLDTKLLTQSKFLPAAVSPKTSALRDPGLGLAGRQLSTLAGPAAAPTMTPPARPLLPLDKVNIVPTDNSRSPVDVAATPKAAVGTITFAAGPTGTPMPIDLIGTIKLPGGGTIVSKLPQR